MKKTNTLVVNMFAGPGAGKSTSAWAIASELKLAGLNAEIVSEYAKELVYEEKFGMLNGSISHQLIIFNEQYKRQVRLIGKVDVIVTDAPLLINALHVKETSPSADDMKQKAQFGFKRFNNFNVYVERAEDLKYETRGRTETLEEAKTLDKETFNLLKFYGVKINKTVNKFNAKSPDVISEIIQAFNALN